jgi:hypothetical protein
MLGPNGTLEDEGAFGFVSTNAMAYVPAELTDLP